MEAMEAMLTRRSIRQYTAAEVDDEMVRRLLEAAMSAPSAGNEQPWHFVCIRDRAILDAVPAFHPHSKMLKQASLAILVCGDPMEEKYRGRWPLDCAAATENMLICANALGLGAVWLAIYPEDDRVEKMRELVNAPSRIVPFALVSVGFPAEHKGPANRYREDRVHREQW